jgi:predicted thioredoxin/glutaredoxin
MGNDPIEREDAEKIVSGQVTHQYDGDLVVFRIGMTFNRW